MTESKKLTPKRRFKEFQNAGDWEQCKLIDMCSLITKGTTPLDKSGKGDVNFIKVENINSNSGEINLASKITLAEHNNYLKRSQLEKDDILFSIAGTLGRVTSVVSSVLPANTNQALAIIRLKDNELNYIKTFLKGKSVADYIKSNPTIGAQPNLSLEQVGNLIIDVPSLDEQFKIGHYFERLDNLITLHQRKLEKLKSMKKAYLYEMFPIEGENRPKRRFKGFTEAWEPYKLSTICSMNARIGWQNLRTSEFLDTGDYYLITGTDFDDGKVNFDTCHYVEKDRYDQDKKIQVTNGSILITKDGTLGKVAYVQGLSKPATLNAGVFNVRITSKGVDEKYLFQYLKAPFLMNYVSSKATGGTIKHLNQNILVDFPVILPNIEEQKAIGEHFNHLDNLITLHQHKLDKLKNLKKAYLNEMFI